MLAMRTALFSPVLAHLSCGCVARCGCGCVAFTLWLCCRCFAVLDLIVFVYPQQASLQLFLPLCWTFPWARMASVFNHTKHNLFYFCILFVGLFTLDVFYYYYFIFCPSCYYRTTGDFPSWPALCATLPLSCHPTPPECATHLLN